MPPPTPAAELPLIVLPTTVKLPNRTMNAPAIATDSRVLPLIVLPMTDSWLL